MTWSSIARPLRRLVDLLRDRRADRRQRRAVRRDLDCRLAAWRALPPDDQVGYVHPASPRKPAGWSAERYIAARRRRDDAN